MAKATKTKKNETPAVKSVKVNIRTKGDHKEFIDWHLGQLPDVYNGAARQNETGYEVNILFEDGEGNQFFASRILANIAAEIRTLDEGNVVVETLPATIEHAEIEE